VARARSGTGDPTAKRPAKAKAEARSVVDGVTREHEGHSAGA